MQKACQLESFQVERDSAVLRIHENEIRERPACQRTLSSCNDEGTDVFHERNTHIKPIKERKGWQATSSAIESCWKMRHAGTSGVIPSIASNHNSGIL
jgi:hypothetical protein